MKFISRSIEDTQTLAAAVAGQLKGGEVILLSGRLGAGKTAFTKCLAKSLGVKDTVTSPTFTFMKSYKGRLNLYHFDMYRAGDEDELYELGLEEYLYAGGVCVIEWNKFSCVSNPITIDIQVGDEGERIISIAGMDLPL
ncbi:MAG: tRNA (adenosine(37)-N6)-threonylcarbamoyltransferase complex ATPase subunit type 1 TsaE [Clostridia bacterium]|nr:tRNA (adenosine(37)-N6)-threonylcarbamoyltransferase complex ATPase subunit type 1 TsaE [Clostridia bacterium]